MRTIVSAVLLAGVLGALAGNARARGREPTYSRSEVTSGEGMRFDDDPLQALTDAERTPFRGCFLPPRIRIDLMRPRTTFIPEMLATVEAI